MPSEKDKTYEDKDSPDNLNSDYEKQFVTKLEIFSFKEDFTFAARMNLKGCHKRSNSNQECHGTDEEKFPRHDFFSRSVKFNLKICLV